MTYLFREPQPDWLSPKHMVRAVPTCLHHTSLNGRRSASQVPYDTNFLLRLLTHNLNFRPNHAPVPLHMLAHHLHSGAHACDGEGIEPTWTKPPPPVQDTALDPDVALQSQAGHSPNDSADSSAPISGTSGTFAVSQAASQSGQEAVPHIWVDSQRAGRCSTSDESVQRVWAASCF